MIAADLHGEEAERTVPPAVQGVVQYLRQKGRRVSVRRSARNGSWYYSVDGGQERNGRQLLYWFDLWYPL